MPLDILPPWRQKRRRLRHQVQSPLRVQFPRRSVHRHKVPSQTVLSTQTVALPSTSSTTSSSTIRSSTNTSVPLQTSTSSTTSSSSQRIISVSIVNGASGNQSLGFSPKTITVVIGVNNTVTWTNNDISLHTVTCINPPTGAQQFNSGFLHSGQTFTMTFTVPGTYTYFCQIHSWMIATIIVKS